MLYTKKVNDFEKHKGKFFGLSWYDHIVTSNQDGYYNENGKEKVLFKFRKNTIPQRYQQLAIDTFLELSKKKHSNRGIAGGINPGETVSRHLTKTGQSEGNYIASNISGYFDRPLREHRGILKTIRACRTTSFTLNNKKDWIHGLPFIQLCSRLYKRFGGKHYTSQKREYNQIKENLKIPKTVFTTITSNYNWRTACHKDVGDYSGGLGNLIVVGKEYTGGYLGFPQFKVLIKIEPGDFLLMDVHQYHCNTAISGNGYRLSFVMYIREDMKVCKKPVYVEKSKYYI